MSKISRYSIASLARSRQAWAAAAARSAFTLIELLVVIAIVALLVAILLPGLAEARRAGKQAKNVANMKGMGTGVQTYAADFKDYIPAYNRAFSTNGLPLLKLKNPLSSWGRNQTLSSADNGVNVPMSIDAIDRMVAASGGLSDKNATDSIGRAVRDRYYPVAMLNYLSGKLPDPSFANPLDRGLTRIIQDAGEYLRVENPATLGYIGTSSIYVFSSSYQSSRAHLQPDFNQGGLPDLDHETSDQTQFTIMNPGKYYANRRVGDVQSPADKVFMFDRIAWQTGKVGVPFQHPYAQVTNVFWDSSVRVVRSIDVNTGGWLHGTQINQRISKAEDCRYDEFPESDSASPLWPTEVTPPARRSGGGPTIGFLFGYQKWTLEGLRGRDVNGKQREN
ncbi:MAG: type II secretion system protein [Phycisphaerales bacterium]